MLIQAIVSLINLIIKALGFTLTSLVNLLPVSPFNSIINQLNVNTEASNWLSYLNTVFDIPFVITVLNIWIVAIVSYYIVSIVLKWVKAL